MPLALVTNGDAREQRGKIERHALAPFFDAILIEGEMGVGKPEAVVYRRALDALGVSAGPNVWMVGDHLEWDVAGSQRAGLQGAWIDRPRRRPSARYGRSARSHPASARRSDACYGSAMRPVRLVIWLATAFFVVMLFTPLVREMFERLSVSSGSGLP